MRLPSSRRSRVAVGALALSAAGLIGLVYDEGFSDRSIVPTKNDRPTIGFGSTVWEDGRAVKMGETITPQRALRVASAHISKDEAAFRDSLPGVALYQEEYDTYINWTYQYGIAAWRDSSMRKRLIAGDYAGACDAMLSYRYLTTTRETEGWEPYKFDASGKPTRWRFDCSKPGNTVCRGVWSRQLERHAKCMAAQ